MEIIDLLNDLANYKEVSYIVVKIGDKEMGKAILNVRKYLNEEIEIVEEDKKIEKIDIGDRVLGFDDSKQDIYIAKNPENEAFAIKINEIIDYINKEK